MRTGVGTGRGARSKGILAVVVGLAFVAAATGCVLDISNDLAGATLYAVNDRGVILAQRNRDVIKIDGTVTTTLTPPATTNWSGTFINNDGVVAGTGQFLPGPQGPVSTFPVVWDRDGLPIDLRAQLENGSTPQFTAYPTTLTDTGLLLGRQYVPGTRPGWRFFVWNLVTRATTYLPLGDNGWASDINDRGVVVGYDSQSKPYRLTPAADGSYATGRFETIPLSGTGINNRGDIVGKLLPDYKDFAVLLGDTGELVTLASHGLPEDPSLPEFGPRARINEKGTVVISQKLGNAATGHPVRYLSARAQPERFPGLNGSTDAEVIDLNNNNRASGYAIGSDGVRRPFSWTVDG
jgi:hypothetical protein